MITLADCYVCSETSDEKTFSMCAVNRIQLLEQDNTCFSHSLFLVKKKKQAIIASKWEGRRKQIEEWKAIKSFSRHFLQFVLAFFQNEISKPELKDQLELEAESVSMFSLIKLRVTVRCDTKPNLSDSYDSKLLQKLQGVCEVFPSPTQVRTGYFWLLRHVMETRLQVLQITRALRHVKD